MLAVLAKSYFHDILLDMGLVEFADLIFLSVFMDDFGDIDLSF